MNNIKHFIKAIKVNMCDPKKTIMLVFVILTVLYTYTAKFINLLGIKEEIL